MNNASVTDLKAQLELGFISGSLIMQVEPRRNSRQVASWWFQRMREVVDRAVAWTPAEMPRPEQIWLPNTHRPVCVKNVEKVASGEKQFCA
jgi:hypothetical protein